MSVDARVSRPAAGADRVRPARVLVAALVGLGAGLGAVGFVAREGAPAASDAPATDAEPRPLPDGDVDDTGSIGAAIEAAPAHDAAVQADAGAQVAPAPVAPAAAEVARPDAGARVSPAQAPRRRSIELGTVAYLRCDGLELGAGRFPCPRDRALEDAGWQALESLGACAEDPGVGVLEVRVELAGHTVADLRYRRVDDSAIDLGVAERCLAPALRGLGTALAPERMIVSFRLVVR